MVATTLAVRDVAVIGINTEDNGNPQRDSITFLLLAPIGSGTQIFFTDRAWNGTSFSAAGGDGTYTYTAGADLPAGTVITINQAQLTGAGINLADAGETLYVYQGTDANTPTQFLHAVDVADGNATFNGNLTNTGLVNGVSAVAIGTDNAAFGTRLHNINVEDLFAQINNNTDWVQNDNSPQHEPSGPVTTAPDRQIWVAGSGAGEAIVTLNVDETHNSGNVATRIIHAFQNDASLFHPSDITLDTVEDRFFFVDADLAGNNRIVQGSISQVLNNPGAPIALTVLYSNTSTGATNSMRTLSIDTVNNLIYFDIGTTLARITYDTAAQTPTVLANLGANNYITQLSIDYDDGRVVVGSSRIMSVFGTDFIERNYVYTATGLTPATGAGGLVFSQLPFTPDDTGLGPEGSPLGGEAWPVERGTIRGIDIDHVNNVLYIVTGSVTLDNDGDGSITYYGGVYSYALTGNPTGTVTTLFQQNGSTGPVGLLYQIEVDPHSGQYYVIDATGTNADPGDGGVWTGSLTVPGTPTLLGTVGNINGLGPHGLEIQTAPTLAGTAGVGLSVTEESSGPASGATSAVTLFSGLSASDLDTADGGDELAGAVVRIVSGRVNEASTEVDHTVSVDILTINGTTSGTIAGSGITYSYSTTTGHLTLTGQATVAEYAAALALVQFSTSGDNVTDDGNSTSRTIAMSVFDGLLHSDEITVNVAVTGINDEPVNTVPGDQTINEDNSRVFSTANSNALSVADADADPAGQALEVTLSVTDGTLTLASTAGLSFSTGDGTGDTTMTFTGTANAINAALGAGLTYNPIADYNGSATLTFAVSDQGFNGTGGAQSDSDTVTITINPVADIADDSETTNEDAAVNVLVQGNDTFENTDHEITAFDQGSNGTVTLDDNGTAADATDDFLVYTPDADFNGSDSFTYTVTSGGVTEMATVNVTVNAVADIADDNVTVDEDSVDNAFDVLANDSFEDSGRSITSVGSASDGTAAIDDNGTVGDTSDDFVTYTPDGDFFGSDSFTYTVTTSGGVTETATVNVTVDPINDAPTSTGLASDSVTWTEGDPVVLLDDGGDATLADVDSADFDTGTLTVAITAGAVTAEDVLGIRNVGVGAGQIGVSGANVTFGGTTIGTFAGGSGGASLVVTFNASASVAAVQELLRNVTYDNTGGVAPTDGDRTVSWTLVDGDGTANGGADTLSFTSTVDVDAVDGAPVAVADGPSVNADVVTDIAVLGNDTDADGGPKGVIEINGSAVSVGVAVVLASGASVTLNADGTIGYDPDGQFDYLVSPATALATGASNGSAADSFTYTLNGGSSTTVSVTVLGVDEPGDELLGTPGADTITGTGGNDVIRGFASGDLLAGLGGNDDLYGGDGSDRLAGGQGADNMYGGDGNDTYQVLNAGDLAFENAGEGIDRVFARVDYTLADNVENLWLLGAARSGTGNGLDNAIFGSGGDDTLFGLDGDDILRGLDGEDTIDGGVGADYLLGGLGADILLGGAGNDRLEGGAGTDTLTGGANRDVFVFRDGDTAATWVDADVVTDFNLAGHERLRLDPMDADTATGGDQAFAFIGAGAFTGVAGQLHYVQSGGMTYVEGDTDGDSTADFVIALTGTINLVADDFVL